MSNRLKGYSFVVSSLIEIGKGEPKDKGSPMQFPPPGNTLLVGG